MPAILLNEYEDQNSRRRYPFADQATMTDTEGVGLPSDFLVDAHLYPMNVTGEVYLSSINLRTSTITFKDAGTNKVCGTCTYSLTSTYAPVLEPLHDRNIGVLVFGTGLGDVVRGSAVRNFAATATRLTPTAFTPLNQVGVRGLLLPDGTLLTGNVTIEGRDGVLVTSRIEDGMHILRFDVVGVPVTDQDECKSNGQPICTVVVQRAAGSRFLISKYDDYTLALTANGLSLDSICAAAKARRRKDDRDPCTDPLVPEEPTPPGEDAELTFEICEMGVGTFMIVAPSTVGNRNPIAIKPLEQSVSPNRLTAPAGTSLDDIAKEAENFRLPALNAGGILIEFQGIGKGQVANNG